MPDCEESGKTAFESVFPNDLRLPQDQQECCTFYVPSA